MTSNIGAEKVTNDNILGFNLDGILENDPKQKNLEKAYVEMKERLTEELKKSLRPELLNRIDDVIIFRGLSDQDMIRIVRLEIGKLNKRIAEKGYMIAVSEGGIEFIAQKGLSKEYGARNIRRTVQNMIESELAELILKKGIGNLDETRVIKVTKVKEGLKFQLD